jgi:hypothetical protein
MTEDDMMIQVSLKELSAMEAVVYAARLYVDGNKSLIDIEQAFAELDSIRDEDLNQYENYMENPDQSTLFEQ